MTTANLLGGLIFGSIGFAAFIYGKKQASFKTMTIGAALIAYPYFIPNTIAVYVIGIGLSAALFFFHD